ncbi:hypothetical protein Pla22_29490 [Rubripirellula amarantea]|uniref:Uncharacterized protein n=1 Tax=Rubripirellula amarantea TaxID=2527999 RepID=A0A5C5WHE3_9BACT|nr:hypothetical protein [Rubripirellula amarantea]TWT50208.1 hypothetical protein Pla22_29490 [Rubripirellula amarantea]
MPTAPTEEPVTVPAEPTTEPTPAPARPSRSPQPESDPFDPPWPAGRPMPAPKA